MEAYRRKNAIDRQKPLIHQFINTDEFALIVLDACRYDVFDDAYVNYISGELNKVWASGRWTAQYCKRTYTEKYQFKYITSIPVFSDFYFELRDMDFRPSNHIQNIVHMWDHEWDASLGTTPPEEITDEALRHANSHEPTRIVAHYAQPHVPYIGDETIDAWSSNKISTDNTSLRDLFTQDAKRPTYAVLDKIRSGQVDDSQLKRAYRSNVDYVMQEVLRLVQRVNCPVVITADHGEHLGENGLYLHENDSTVVRQIPWLVVNSSEIGTRSNEKDPGNAHVSGTYAKTEDEIKNHLRNLGYN